MSIFSISNRVDFVVMVSIIVTLGVLEMLGVFLPKFVTITQLIKGAIPMPFRYMIMAWLYWHFIGSDLVRYKP